jgi:hypothetical protein
MTMRKLFVSYARENKRDVVTLVDHLKMLGHEPWVDTSLRGGQEWWEVILRRIADCDAFIAIVSPPGLASTACRHEFDWAVKLGKPVLPVAVESLSTALPGRLAGLQIVDYSDPAHRDRAALMVAGALSALPVAPSLPDQLPDPPPTPLSYLTSLIDLVSEDGDLTHDQQREIVIQLERALRSLDPEERRGGRDVLQRLSIRHDLYVDTDRVLQALKSLPDPRPADDATTAEPPSVVSGVEKSAPKAPPAVEQTALRPPPVADEPKPPPHVPPPTAHPAPPIAYPTPARGGGFPPGSYPPPGYPPVETSDKPKSDRLAQCR